MANELLTVEEVANYLRVGPNTVYRWCRDNRLPAIKLGKEWRITPRDLETFVNARRTGSQVVPVEQIFSSNFVPPEHVLVMLTNQDAVYEMESGFFKIGRQQSRHLLKGCWWQHPDDVRQRYADAGIPVEEWETEGWLFIEDFRSLYRARGPEAVYEVWTQRAKRSDDNVFWGAGSHLVNDWDGNYDGLFAFEEGLHSILQQLPVVSLCCCVVSPAEEAATSALLNLATHHTGSLFVTGGSAVLMRPVTVGGD